MVVLVGYLLPSSTQAVAEDLDLGLATPRSHLGHRHSVRLQTLTLGGRHWRAVLRYCWWAVRSRRLTR